LQNRAPLEDRHIEHNATWKADILKTKYSWENRHIFKTIHPRWQSYLKHTLRGHVYSEMGFPISAARFSVKLFFDLPSKHVAPCLHYQGCSHTVNNKYLLSYKIRIKQSKYEVRNNKVEVYTERY
jgi:hypothetical protein